MIFTDSKVFTSEWKVKVAVFLGDVHPVPFGESKELVETPRNPLRTKKTPGISSLTFFLRNTSFQCFNIMTFCATASRPVPVQSRVKCLKTRPFPVEISQRVDGWSAAHRFSVSQAKIGLNMEMLEAFDHFFPVLPLTLRLSAWLIVVTLWYDNSFCEKLAAVKQGLILICQHHPLVTALTGIDVSLPDLKLGFGETWWCRIGGDGQSLLD